MKLANAIVKEKKPDLASIVRGFPSFISTESTILSVNARCNVDPHATVIPEKTYSFGEIYDELRNQGFHPINGSAVRKPGFQKG
jgi:hypothetical protein